MSRTRQDILDDLFNLKIKRGYTEFQLKEYLMSPPYNYSLRNTQLYLKLLREHILDVLKEDKEYSLKTTLERLERIEQELLVSGDKRLSLEYRKEINKIQGIYPTQKVDVTSGGNTIIPQVIYLNLPPDDGVKN
jgi:hypothetical protein